VKERTVEIEEANTTLSVLVEKMRKNKESIEKNVLENIKQLILPNLKRIQKDALNPQQRLRLEILEKNLHEIISPLTGKMTANFFNFTSMEMQVADLIVRGKTTKEIAMILNVSAKTIGFHRGNIREKIGIKNKNDSLRLSLLSLP
jgi:DNA-binding CsgD family transcriptional regulator